MPSSVAGNYLSSAKEVVKVARASISHELLLAGGRALYSPASTLAGQSPYYILGVNPREEAGSAELHRYITIAEDLERLEMDEIREHAFLDELSSNVVYASDRDQAASSC